MSSTSASSAALPSVVVEVLHNVRTVLVTIQNCPVDVKLRLDATRLEAHVELGPAGTWVCALPKAVRWEQPAVQYTRGSDHQALRIAMEPLGPHETALLDLFVTDPKRRPTFWLAQADRKSVV